MKFRYTVLLILSLIVITLGVNVQPALAQLITEPTGFKNVTLWVYPEYDNPRLLVMLEGQITGANPPAQIRFLVPQAAEMYSAGSKDAQGKYSGGPPNRKASQVPGWDEISYTLNSNTFRVEYYDDIITGSPDKKISYDFRWLYPISDLRIIIQQPKTASNFAVLPSGTQTIEEGFGVNTFNKSNLTLDPGAQPIHFDVSYTKTDANLSQSDPIISTGEFGSSNSSSNLIPILSMVIALVAVAAFMVIFIIKRKSRGSFRHATRVGPSNTNKLRYKFQKEKRTVSRTQSAAGGAPTITVGTRQGFHKDKFCNLCGQPAEKSNKFCPNCGNKLGIILKISDDT